MENPQDMQQEALIAELTRLRSVIEAAVVPQIIESMLSLRLTMQQVKVLSILVIETEGSSIGQLAQTLDVSMATMSGIVERLENQLMVERIPDPRDQRVRLVLATALGRQTIQKLLSSNQELDHAQLKKIAVEDLAALVQGIRAIAEVVQRPPA